MRTTITVDTMRKLPQTDTDIWDEKYPGLVLRCRQSGRASWRVSYGRGKWITLGRADTLTPEEARKQARIALGDVAKGHDPAEKRQAERARILFGDFISEHYEPWATAQRKTGAEQTARLRATFGAAFRGHRLDEITAFDIERWRSARLKAGKASTTVNRDLNTLRAALNLAVTWKLLKVSPMDDVKASKVDRAGVVRYLTPDEEKRLLKALDARDGRRREQRESANTWRQERGYKLRTTYGTYTDHMTPFVILALHTGLRRGELFHLRWRDIDLVRAMLTVHGAKAKSGQTRHVPLNTTALETLKNWRGDGQHDRDDLVFPGAEGAPLDDIKKGWATIAKAAHLTDFRFHDLRHTFASKLVMAGVDLNTVRELLGHADLKMTLRYAHLAPEAKAAAVAKLVRA